MKKFSIRRIIWILVVLVAAGAILYALRPRSVRVEAAAVTRGVFQQTVDEDGKTHVRDRYVVSAPLAGKLARITLKVGDPVRRGDVLASITPSLPPLVDVRTEQEQQARLQSADAARLQADAQVARARANLAQAQADLARTRMLAAQGFVSKSQLEQEQLRVNVSAKEAEAATFAYHVAHHQADEARAALTRLRQGAGNVAGAPWVIRSPVSGQVLKVTRESEGDVPLGAPLLEIGNTHNIEVVAEMLTTDAVKIPKAAPVIIENWGQPQPLQGRVRRVEPAAFTKVSALGIEEQRSNVDIDIVSPPREWQALGDGYRVDVRVVIYRNDNATKVPASALFREGDHWAVFVIQGGRARKRQVQFNHRNGKEAMITQGLSPGEQVVVYPSEAIKNGGRVAAS